MRRTGFARRVAGAASSPVNTREERLASRAARAMAEVVPTASSIAPVTAACVPVLKAMLVDSKPYRRVVAGLACMWCGLQGSSQHAHLNRGKGLGLKTDDRTGFPLCASRPGVEGCHVAYDQYRLVEGGNEAHHAYGLEWGRITRAEILSLGLWPINLPLWQETTSSK
ncbi:hypothetical protein [Pantoea sp. 18069]|uniref:hypothetical protein n=1 Tax=Pantoea sp. 18069 TaxID=2681415 RepID=UPI0013584550|nr:hypothetical protein [Pantoea sp. 18069]